MADPAKLVRLLRLHIFLTGTLRFLTGALRFLTGTLRVVDTHFSQCSCGSLPVLPVQPPKGSPSPRAIRGETLRMNTDFILSNHFQSVADAVDGLDPARVVAVFFDLCAQACDVV